MQCTLKYSFFLQALLVQRIALAGRRETDLGLELEPDQPTSLRSLLSGADIICGGSEIWTLLTGNPTVGGVQGIKWEKIDATAREYIKTQQALEGRLNTQIESLAERIEEKKGKEQIKGIAPEQIRDLISTAVTAGFESLESGQRTKCGVPSIRPRAPRGAFRKSEGEFRSASESFFTGDVRLGSAPFLDVCSELLSCQDEEPCYCPSLCQVFRDIAQEISDATAGANAGATVEELMRQQKEKLEALEKAKQEEAECRQARETLGTFRAQMEELKKGVKVRFDDLRAAEEALDDAQWELADLEDLLAKEQDSAASALQALEKAGEEFEAARSAFEALQEQEAALGGQLNASKASLQAGRQELERAKSADRIVGDLKNLLSVTLMKMQLFFDEAVRQPVRSLGITEERALLGELFAADLSGLAAAGVMKTAVESLHTFCAVDAKEPFEAVKDKVDLSPLCEMGEVDAIDTDLTTAVATRVGTIVELLEEVRAWLNPFKDQKNMTNEKLKELHEAGEPSGLREIVSVYGETRFFSYLKDWKAGGRFLKLIAQLGEAVESLGVALKNMQEDLDKLKEEIQKTMAARQEAQEALEKAAMAVQLAEDTKAEIDRKVKELEEQGVEMKNEIAELEAQVAEARRKFEAAKNLLLEEHQKSTSFLQFWEEEDEAVDALRSETSQAHEQMVRFRIQALQAERVYNNAAARLREVERQEDAKDTRRREAMAAARSDPSKLPLPVA
eukprot:CAMPEP_0179124354 /NCGR_PEP_ID=MMETSP0796-20121207/58762_1 /TAXON_ID=73915 /ORGANISM="Pyrodinium bahamense, Strain pbaha01" /LENGTH=734 /DNA_ID=CAMNT_0020823013 /DNA_START=82 /DNA_END=2286 /DNA_ORIENTATION=-